MKSAFLVYLEAHQSLVSCVITSLETIHPQTVQPIF